MRRCNKLFVRDAGPPTQVKCARIEFEQVMDFEDAPIGGRGRGGAGPFDIHVDRAAPYLRIVNLQVLAPSARGPESGECTYIRRYASHTCVLDRSYCQQNMHERTWLHNWLPLKGRLLPCKCICVRRCGSLVVRHLLTFVTAA
jgi:hypothetical protein